ncbi:hypothetical protein AAH025_20595 [Bacteroides fragilis]|jgi:hypothetical protein|uniref:hypothetical protein n=1 Tax=Bacteroides fragilis TaxID=817 RepID=UPI0039B368F0
MRRKLKTKFYFLCFMLITLYSCSDEYIREYENKEEYEKVTTKSLNNKEQLLERFATILSKTIYENSDIRLFLKSEAIKQFDKNYDILYYLIKDKLVNGKSIRDLLITYSSEEEITTIEEHIPLLNILIPEISFFNINAENMNIDDKEIPVAIAKKDKNILYLNGKKELELDKGEIPNFHTFVVNENNRVIIPNTITRNTSKKIIFKSPNFDGSTERSTRSIDCESEYVGEKAIQAFSYFNKDDGSINQKAFQRDYIYYGITPNNRSGSLNRSVSEYISYLEINPKLYFKIADQRVPNQDISNNDPYIQTHQTEIKKRELTEDELLDRMWTKGAYNIRFEIITSTNLHPQIIYIPLKPDEIWDFNIERTRRHKTMFRHTKYTYKIDPNKFTAKRIFLTPTQISLGKWNLAEESIYRYVNIIEEDESIETTYSDEYEVTRIKTNKFNGDIKLDIGIGETGSDKVSAEAGAEATNSNTIRETKKVSIVRKEESDNLGSLKIYFYDPIIEKKLPTENGKQKYQIHTYSSGSISFALTAK